MSGVSSPASGFISESHQLKNNLAAAHKGRKESMRISKKLAREIVENTREAGRGLLDVGIAVCEYVSRHYAEELTTDQGARLAKLVEEVRKEVPDFRDPKLFRKQGFGLLDHIAAALADRTDLPVEEIKKELHEVGTDAMWERYVGPMLDDIEDHGLDEEGEG